MIGPATPFPVVFLWEKDFLEKWTEWVDKQIELRQYANRRDAAQDIMRLTNGRMNPAIIFHICDKRGLE
jgi:hypothetical protein